MAQPKSHVIAGSSRLLPVLQNPFLRDLCLRRNVETTITLTNQGTPEVCVSGMSGFVFEVCDDIENLIRRKGQRVCLPIYRNLLNGCQSNEEWDDFQADVCLYASK